MRTTASSSDADRLSTAGRFRQLRASPIAALVATAGGAGFSPLFPGTAGSAVGLVLAWLLSRAIASALPSVPAAVGLLMSGLVIGLAGVPAASRVARGLGQKDPECVVIDEVAGQFLASAVVPLFVHPSGLPLWILSFFFFRLFDVWKPGLVNRLQALPEGWGIVADDIAAGFLAAGATAAAAFTFWRP